MANDENLRVYIQNIPTDWLDNDLERLIPKRMKDVLRVELDNIKCYSQFGMAVIRLVDEGNKEHLISTVQSMVLDAKTNTMISFTSAIELDTYVVVDRKISEIPSAEAVSRRYMQTYKTSEPSSCKSVSLQFPNIFRISLSTLHELAKAASAPDFRMDNVFATVYPYADCSFFEDLPLSTNEDKLLSAIAAQTDGEQLGPTSIYVQYDKETSNAVVLASKSNKKWMLQSFVKLEGRNISKKVKLANRVIASPVPLGFDVDHILQHELFAGRTVRHTHINDHLIVELKDMNSYEKCLKYGALRIGKLTVNIDKHSIASGSETGELNADNWYETEMLDTKPDIVPILSNHQHLVFRYKWNAEYWLEQFNKPELGDRRSGKYDLHRHLLRVTVMLNTISILRKKKYTVDGEEITLNLPRMRTIGYDHRAKLSFGKTISSSELTTPYPSTSVIVSNEDCLVLYEKLGNEGYRPLLLNMANATSPGGGYRKGDGAQEENLFRRSDYYQSLDLEIADRDRSERLYCTPNCDDKRPTGYAGLYPMEEFGAIYTSGITVFRGTEHRGYPYMKDPLYNVCSIAMAAHREPGLTNKNMLEKKFATSTRKKIENIFAIGHRHNHDCLVLSAFGCGAFKNPPEHVALLFKSVIYQYAGYFKKIYFAIIDDHNAGNKHNPKGNYLPFKEKLDGLIVHAPKAIHVNGVNGPYRISKTLTDEKLVLSDVYIQHLPPCHHGTECRNTRNDQHNAEFSHPPVCLHQKLNSICDQMNDEVHVFTFFHRIKCRDAGECTNTDPNHFIDFDHPEFCKSQSNCMNMDPEHLQAYRHLPICPEGITCLEYMKKIPAHISKWRHCRTVCPKDNCCSNFHNRDHVRDTIHSFNEPCTFTPYNCTLFIQYLQAAGKAIPTHVENHCFTYSHVCQFGRLCKTTDDGHYATSIHIARQLCPDDDKCLRITDENHLQSFSHTGIRDIRLFCRHPGYKCPNRFDDRHLKIYRHARDFNHPSVAPCRNLNTKIDFFRNQGNIIKTVNSYVDASKWKKANISEDILNWIRALQPVHRCSPDIFSSILVHGHVMSRDYMSELIKPRCVVNAVMQHNQIRSIFHQHNTPAVRQHAKELIKLFVKEEFLKAGSAEVHALDADHGDQINILKKQLKPPLDEDDFKTIFDQTAKIVVASIELGTHLAGIGFDVDKKLETDKHVFSILGPHCGTYYGDIVITFKQELMFHPDANVSVQAGTGFFSGRVYNFRPWWIDPTEESKRIEHFHRSKLHCSYPRYEYAAAAELIASTGKIKQTMDVDLTSIIRQWKQVDSHFVFEGHLPPLIPLDYVENVYIPKNIFKSLSIEAQTSAREIFKESLILADYDVDLSLIKPGTTTPLDATRKPYLDFILNQLSEKIDERIQTPHLSRGFVITIPETSFGNHIVLPITITQSYNLYCLNTGKPPTNIESTYIYWQAMDGDMMLTVTNERIAPDGKDQPDLRCLVCYVAEKPSTTADEYHEASSYLNTGSPYNHSHNVDKSIFKAKSNRFYRGCNTDDFFTFCLKILYKTGEVSLSHAGPNGIYNRESIQHKFNRSELDLLKLNYIHISAGSHDVPIRNLTINHKPVAALHPTFDDVFQLDTSVLINRQRSATHHPTGIVKRTVTIGRPENPKKPSVKRSVSTVDVRAEPSSSEDKRSVFGKIKNALFGGSKKKNDQPVSNPPASNPPPSKPPPSESLGEDYHAKSDYVPYSPSKPPSSLSHPSKPMSTVSKAPAAGPSPLISSTLPSCLDSIYCLKQSSKEHTDKYSHPCRYNDMCTKQAQEPHLVHKRHDISMCLQGRDCSELGNPVHRAEYRHSGLADYLIPCHFQDRCHNISVADHRKIYFHGEEIPSFKKNSKPSSPYGAVASSGKLTMCKFGKDCRDKMDPKHAALFSHPSS